MKIRGNYHLFYACCLISGILTYFALHRFGDIGLVLGVLPAGLARDLMSYKHKPDERELSVYRQVDSYVFIGIGLTMLIVHLFFPNINWFYTLISAMFALRGAIGLIMFSIK
ncbi:MAG: hypothetical protein LHW56_09365 [Candidatus Cloacimonetes bacterium]|jgi:hypothetical protein|nr:hypothetical protein [Candidatus Cloacimonadota bacterium]MDY0173100.1 hypothetical protein [Candidatus Cloacimonadaceae bacterium]